MSTEKLMHDIPFVIDAAKRQAQPKPTEAYHTMIVAPSGEPKSLLSRLTPEQQQALCKWADEQPRGNGGTVDLMGWPGWAEAIMSRMEPAISAESKALAQDEYHKTGADNGILKFNIRTGKFLE